MANTNLYTHLAARDEPAIGQPASRKLHEAHPLAIPTIAGLFLLTHVLGIVLFPRRADVISISFQVSAPFWPRWPASCEGGKAMLKAGALWL
jgi:hypothetical protein